MEYTADKLVSLWENPKDKDPVGPLTILLLNLSCGMADAITAAELVTQTLHYCVLLQHYWAGCFCSFPAAPGHSWVCEDSPG